MTLAAARLVVQTPPEPALQAAFRQCGAPVQSAPAPCYIGCMKLRETYRVEASLERVWDALLDPEVVRDCVPGIRAFDVVSPDSYRVEIGVKVGLFSGALTGTLNVTDRAHHSSYRMMVNGAGPMTNLSGEALVSLAAEGEAATIVTLDGEVSVTGSLARVGQRFMSSAAKSQFDHFFGKLREKLE